MYLRHQLLLFSCSYSTAHIAPVCTLPSRPAQALPPRVLAIQCPGSLERTRQTAAEQQFRRVGALSPKGRWCVCGSGMFLQRTGSSSGGFVLVGGGFRFQRLRRSSTSCTGGIYLGLRGNINPDFSTRKHKELHTVGMLCGHAIPIDSRDRSKCARLPCPHPAYLDGAIAKIAGVLGGNT